MTRKEEILGYCGECHYKPFSIEACTAIKAIEWADQHPRDGLWDSEKVIEWLDHYADSYTYFSPDKQETGFIGQMFDDLRKAMEE
jgi:hypothetical protein